MKPWVGFKGPEDKSMIAMWGDATTEMTMVLGLYKNFMDCYMDLIVQHPENRRPGMLVMHRKRAAEEEAKKAEERRRREAPEDTDARLGAFIAETINRMDTLEGVWAQGEDEPQRVDFAVMVTAQPGRRSASSEALPERPAKGRRKGGEGTEGGERRAEASTQMVVDLVEPSAREEPSVAPPALPADAEQAAPRVAHEGA